MTNQLRISKKNNKKTKNTKTVNQTTKTQKGRGIFKTDIKTYSNLKYKDSSFKLSNLVCPVKGCNGKEFKQRMLKISTFGKALLLDTNFFNNKNNAFTCTKCGFIQLYSANITYDSEKV